MALSAAQTTQIFKILGLPQTGVGVAAGPVATLFGPMGETYDFSTLVTMLNTRLSACTSSMETEVGTLLTRYALIATSQMKFTLPGGGMAADHAAEREEIRETLSNIFGFTMKKKFTQEIREQSGGGNRIIR